MLTPEEKAKQKALQEQYGDDCAFFAPPELGLLPVILPEDPSEPFWTRFKKGRTKGLDKLGVAIEFALAFVPTEQRAAAGALFRRKGGFADTVAKTCARLCGNSEPESPELSDDERATLERLSKENQGDVAYFRPAGLGLLIVAVPKNPAAYRQFYNDHVNDVDDVKPQEVYETFALDCVVHPDRDRVASYLKRKPALTVTLANCGARLCGGGYEELGKA